MEKTALITGGSRGIGLEIVKVFEKHAYKVLAPTREEMDLRDHNSIVAYCEKLDKTIDVIVNNAGINAIATIENLNNEVFQDMIQVNLLAPLTIIQFFKEKMRQNSIGRIVNISSIWSAVSKTGRGGYAATKSAINSITKTLSIELAPNILINAVAPGFVNTELTRQNNSPEEIKNITSSIPMGRLAEPAEIARLVYFLASENNTYITGQTVFIDGGYTCK
ncbi:MAG: SDR family oxidoreductase [Bacteroidales bacterium]|jgi:3-oxoacyl-[acyl-carrier protein] reductase|nr:SDR family oxidoreductase [Bacteroidales bacterium]